MDSPPRSALIVAHPGHELRVHHWLELAQPLVFVLTDGSGSDAESRLHSTEAVLGAAGARAGTVMGRFTDEALYRAIMDGDADAFAPVVEEIANALVEQRIEAVVADACEFYNPAHDLCRAIANLAVQRAGANIATYEYAVVGTPDAEGLENETVIQLDDAALQRKIDAANNYPELRKDVDIALRLDRLDAFRVEVLRRLDAEAPLPVPEGRAFYERAGEEHVVAGRYETVLRHDEHFAPLVATLASRVVPMLAAR
ncbi:MAG TPA: hypothetical protein VEU30_16005 [Thermoanaerobaculia bacterium]|nr:hypothetical protein [Thermoanaerobaculia bacterium]